MAVAQKNEGRVSPAFSAEEIDPQHVVVAYLLHKMAQLPKQAIADLASLATELAECNNQEDLRGIVQTIKEILFSTELLGTVSEDVQDEIRDEGLRKYGSMVGDRIRELRTERKWTQEELATKAGLTQEHVSRLERGEHSPSRKTLERIAQAMTLQVRDIDHTEN